MSQKTCPKCSAVLDAGAIFCTTCGYNFQEENNNQFDNQPKRKISKSLKNTNDPLRPTDKPIIQNQQVPPIPPTPPIPNNASEKDTKVCPKCQKTLDQKAAFCHNCGFSFNITPPPVANNVPPIPPTNVPLVVVTPPPVQNTPPPPTVVTPPPVVVSNPVVEQPKPVVEPQKMPTESINQQNYNTQTANQPPTGSNKTIFVIIGIVVAVVLLTLLAIFVIYPKFIKKPLHVVVKPKVVTSYFICSSIGSDGKQMNAALSNIISTNKAGATSDGASVEFNKAIKTKFPKNYFIFKNCYCQPFKSLKEATDGLKTKSNDFSSKKYKTTTINVTY